MTLSSHYGILLGMNLLNYILKPISFKPLFTSSEDESSEFDENTWDIKLRQEQKYRKAYEYRHRPFAQKWLGIPSDDEIGYEGKTYGQIRQQQLREMLEHEEWLKQKADRDRKEEKKLKKYPGEMILDYPFIPDKNGKVNLQAQGNDDTEGLAKLRFQIESYSILTRMGLAPDCVQRFKEMSYDDIMERLELAKTMDNYPHALNKEKKLHKNRRPKFYC